jgi:hypothetical protein
MSTKRNAASRSKALNRVFGPPPLLEGEDAAAYDEMLTRASNAVGPTDFIEEIWVRDLTDVAWGHFRLRRILAAFLTAEVSVDASEAANEEATSLAEAEAQLMEGAEKEEMNRFLQDDSLSWEELAAQNPRANEKFQKLWASAMSNLNMDQIHAKVMLGKIDTIERIEHLIMLGEQRVSAILREIDRHRVMVKQRDRDVRDFEEAEFQTVNPKKITHKQVA